METMLGWWSSVDVLRTIAQVISALIVLLGLLALLLNFRIAQVQKRRSDADSDRLRTTEQALANARRALLDARREAKNLRARHTESERRATEVAKQLEQMRQPALPRGLSDVQRKKLTDVLGQAPKSRIGIEVLVGDSEAFTFANQLRGALESCGFMPQQILQVALPHRPIGVRVIAHDPETPFTAELQQALREIGVTADAILSRSRNEPLTLLVGARR